MKISAIAVDGVLRKLVGGSPIPEGIRLYRSLVSTGRVVFLTDGSADDLVADWLELNGCTGRDFIARLDGVHRLRRQGYDIDLVVVPDPLLAAELIATGLNVLLFTHAKYAQPSWRPDAPQGVRPWDEITHQVAQLARMKAADERLNPDD